MKAILLAGLIAALPARAQVPQPYPPPIDCYGWPTLPACEYAEPRREDAGQDAGFWLWRLQREQESAQQAQDIMRQWDADPHSPYAQSRRPR